MEKKNSIRENNAKSNGRKISFSYDSLWKAIIRPSRDVYSQKDLGPPKFICKKNNYSRKDYDIVGKKGNILKCTFFEKENNDHPESLPVIIFLHGNSGSRRDVLKYLRIILENEMNIFCFDFSGCGLSEGDYISLGYYEKEDLKIIVNFVSKLPYVSSIGLWGHSMGAATAVLYGAIDDNKISCICADSSFSDFLILTKEIVNRKVKLPKLIFSASISFIRKTIIKKNNFDIYELKPVDEVKKIKAPIMFVHGIKDELIDMKHSVSLFEKCGASTKIINFFDGGHNTKRDRQLIKKIIEFFKEHLNKEIIQI